MTQLLLPDPLAQLATPPARGREYKAGDPAAGMAFAVVIDALSTTGEETSAPMAGGTMATPGPSLDALAAPLLAPESPPRPGAGLDLNAGIARPSAAPPPRLGPSSGAAPAATGTPAGAAGSGLLLPADLPAGAPPPPASGAQTRAPDMRRAETGPDQPPCPAETPAAPPMQPPLGAAAEAGISAGAAGHRSKAAARAPAPGQAGGTAVPASRPTDDPPAAGGADPADPPRDGAPSASAMSAAAIGSPPPLPNAPAPEPASWTPRAAPLPPRAGSVSGITPDLRPRTPSGPEGEAAGGPLAVPAAGQAFDAPAAASPAAEQAVSPRPDTEAAHGTTDTGTRAATEHRPTSRKELPAEPSAAIGPVMPAIIASAAEGRDTTAEDTASAPRAGHGRRAVLPDWSRTMPAAARTAALPSGAAELALASAAAPGEVHRPMAGQPQPRPAPPPERHTAAATAPAAGAGQIVAAALAAPVQASSAPAPGPQAPSAVPPSAAGRAEPAERTGAVPPPAQMRITASMPDNPAPATKTEHSQTPAPTDAAPAPVPPAEAAPDSRSSGAPVRPITAAPAGAAPAMAASLPPPSAAVDGVNGVGGARSAPASIAPDAAPQPQPALEQAGTGQPAPETGAQTAAAAARPRSDAAPAAPPMVAPAFAGRADPQGRTAARPESPARAAAGPTATEPHSALRAAVRPTPNEGGDAAGQTRATTAAPVASGPDGPGLAAPASAPASALAGREIGHVPAHHVLRQLHEAVVHRPDGPVEVALSPEELGRVRLTLHPAEHGITVAVQAERPETLDLMRRNIEMLARDFRDLGYTDVSFSFGAESGRQQRDETAPDNSFGAEPDGPAPVTPAAAPPHPAPRGTDGSLDLRM